MLQMIVFDVAGTTVDDTGDPVAAAVCRALAGAGVDCTPAQVDPVMGIPKPDAIAHLLAASRGTRPDTSEVQRVHESFRSLMLEHYRTGDGVREIHGAGELFARMRDAGVRVTLDTGFDRPILDAILERLGWHGAIDDSITSDEVRSGRPAPDMIRTLMARAGITHPASVAKVGDSASDVEEGLAAGCGLVIAIDNPRTRDAARAHPAVVSAATLADVAAALDAFAAGVPT